MDKRMMRRLVALEERHHLSADKLVGTIALRAGQTPLQALDGADVGLWFITDANQTGWLGQVNADGTRTVYGSEQ